MLIIIMGNQLCTHNFFENCSDLVANERIILRTKNNIRRKKHFSSANHNNKMAYEYLAFGLLNAK